MNYENFQRQCARYGFTSTPLTRLQYKVVIVSGLNDADAYNIGCDVAAGFSFMESLRENKAAMLNNAEH